MPMASPELTMGFGDEDQTPKPAERPATPEASRPPETAARSRADLEGILSSAPSDIRTAILAAFDALSPEAQKVFLGEFASEREKLAKMIGEGRVFDARILLEKMGLRVDVRGWT